MALSAKSISTDIIETASPRPRSSWQRPPFGISSADTPIFGSKWWRRNARGRRRGRRNSPREDCRLAFGVRVLAGDASIAPAISGKFLAGGSPGPRQNLIRIEACLRPRRWKRPTEDAGPSQIQTSGGIPR